jgi:hypothetical protein
VKRPPIYLAPLAIVTAEVWRPALTPAATKLSPVVNRIEKPTVTETCTKMVGIALGGIWRNPMRYSELPAARAASANGVLAHL